MAEHSEAACRRNGADGLRAIVGFNLQRRVVLPRDRRPPTMLATCVPCPPAVEFVLNSWVSSWPTLRVTMTEFGDLSYNLFPSGGVKLWVHDDDTVRSDDHA